MYILTRYVVWEVLKYFLATLVALTLVVTPVMGVKEGLNQGTAGRGHAADHAVHAAGDVGHHDSRVDAVCRVQRFRPDDRRQRSGGAEVAGHQPDGRRLAGDSCWRRF